MWSDLGLLALRLTVGLLFIGHGAQKAFGAFGGYGLAGTAGFLESLGLKPGRFWAALAAWGELVGGALVLLGLATPLGALLIAGSMAVAIAKVHGPKGLWNTNGGYEYNLVLTVAALALILIGPGRLSLDALIGLPR